MQELARQLASLAQEQRQHRQQQRGNAAAGSAAAAAAAAAVTGGPDTQSGAVMHAPSGYEDQGKIHAGGSAGAPSKGPSQGDPRFVAVQDIHEPSWGNSPPARQHLPLQQQQAQLQQQQGTWPTLHSHLTPLPPQPVRPWQDHTWSRHAAAHQQPRGTLQDSPQQQHQYQLVYQQQQHQLHQHLLQQQVSPSSGPLQGAIPMAVHGQAASEQQVLEGSKEEEGVPLVVSATLPAPHMRNAVLLGLYGDAAQLGSTGHAPAHAGAGTYLHETATLAPGRNGVRYCVVFGMQGFWDTVGGQGVAA